MGQYWKPVNLDKREFLHPTNWATDSSSLSRHTALKAQQVLLFCCLHHYRKCVAAAMVKADA